MQTRRPRIREIISIGELPPGPMNSIIDVKGVKVGHSTIIRGEGELKIGEGPVRTGVTAIIPHEGNVYQEKVTAAAHVINGFGKSIGLAQIQELGSLETPILLTNTLNVARVSDALITYMLKTNPEIGITTGTVNPVVGECNDGYLNDIQGRHVSEADVLAAIEGATNCSVEEGAVGAGTGMYCYHFKGGIGTASRLIQYEEETYVVGVLVVSNFGRREDLTIAGIPIGRELKDWPNETQNKTDDGSIMVVLATDAPLSSRQLGRLARRVPLGLARTGSIVSHGSGDFVIAFSTTYRKPHKTEHHLAQWERILEDGKLIDLFFRGTVEVVEEAVLNSLTGSKTVVGRDGHTAYGLPIEQVKELLTRYGR